MAAQAAGTTGVQNVRGNTGVRPNPAAAGQLYPGPLFSHVGPLTRCELQGGTTGLRDDFGNAFESRETFGIGPGFHCVNVQLSGWKMDFSSKDHHIEHIQVRIKNVFYEPGTGSVTFTVSGVFRDKNGDDNFEWEVWFTILAIGGDVG